jgi:hypothetical protein
MRALKEDIEKAKQNDFGARIYEAFIGEARRAFFNSHKELSALLKKINEQQNAHNAEKKELIKKINEANAIAKKAIAENRQIKESATRNIRTAKLLNTLPPGDARAKMKTLLEASSVADLDKTFRKYASSILQESKKPIRSVESNREQFNEHAISVRNGNGRNTVSDDMDDEDIVNLRRLAFGINK